MVAAGALQSVERRLLGAANWKGNTHDLEQQRLIGGVERRARASRHGSDRVAVIAMLQRDDARALLAEIAPIAQRHFDRDLDASGAAVRIEDVIETLGREGDEAARKRLRRLMRVAGEDDLIELLGLFADRPHDLGLAMAVGDDPPGRNGVENARSVHRLEPTAFGARDLDRARLQGVLRIGAPHGRMSDDRHAVCSPVKSPRAKAASKAERSASRVSGASNGKRPNSRAPPIVAIVRCASLVFVAHESDADDWNVTAAQRFDREKTVVDRAERRARDKDDGKLPAREHIDGEHVGRQRNHALRPLFR